jgi:DNA-binding HxlR family transcriptional regulator
MIVELLAHKDYVRVLFALRGKPRRFVQIQKMLGLNPVQVDRALGFLRRGLWIIPRTVPTNKGRLIVEYSLGKRGASFLESFDTFRSAVKRRKAALGPSEVAEVEALNR